VQVVDPLVVVGGGRERRRPRAVPGAELALDVAVVAAEVVEADVVRLDGVQRGQRRDERRPDRRPRLEREPLLDRQSPGRMPLPDLSFFMSHSDPLQCD
jgi:hypothetical protein